MTRATRRRPALAAVAITSSALLALGLTGTADAGTGHVSAPASRPHTPLAPAAKASASRGSGGAEQLGSYDARQLSGPVLARRTGATLRAHGRAVAGLGRALGDDTSISLDPLTGTVSNVTDRLGYLTPASRRSASSVALGFVRSHLSGLGLRPGDLATLHRTRRYTDINGITHVYWVQRADGVPVFGNGLRADVSRTGRLITVQGAPVSGLRALAAKAAAPRLGALAARRAAVADVDGHGAGGQHATASRSWFLTTAGLRPSWTTYTQPSLDQGFEHVVDAATGRTLYRRSTVDNLVPTGDTESTRPGTLRRVGVPSVRSAPGKRRITGQALVHDNYPGATGFATHGTEHVVNLQKLHFLTPGATWLHGRWVKVWADVHDNNKIDPGEKTAVPRNASQFHLKTFRTAKGQTPCTTRFPCTYDPLKPYSWRTNENQDGVQALYFASRYAKWLSQEPIGFTASAGNFTTAGHDPVHVQIMDGGATDHGLPDAAHLNNANFNTPPDGTSPVMQMYLNNAPYLAADSAETFDNVGHEFTHGLSSRLVVDSQGFSTLDSYQAGAMGEGWSDFYAEDFELAHGFYKRDSSKPGEIMFDRYLSKNRAYTRSEAIDCPVGKAARLCRQVDGDPGGYTYGDIPAELGTEVHSASEPWSQTLWDLHRKLGHEVTMRLVTAAMSLSPDDPSMLDERNAILTADLVIYHKAHTATIWRTFAHRGFGYYAASIDAADTEPVQDFHVPPAASAKPGTVSGTVTDTTGAPVAGATVLIAGHTSGTAGNWSAVTRADGTYSIGDVAPGTYPKVVALGDGYGSQNRAVTVHSGATTTADFTLRRDYAAASGGAKVISFDGPDFSDDGCGPVGAIDSSTGTGWGSVTGASEATPVTSASDVTPKSIVIELPEAVALTSFGIDPSATCGDAGSSSTGAYSLEVGDSPTGPWTTVASGTFTEDQQGTTVDVPVSVPAPVRYVRYTMEGPQVPDYAQCPDAFTGCTYMDTTEVSAFAD